MLTRLMDLIRYAPDDGAGGGAGAAGTSSTDGGAGAGADAGAKAAADKAAADAAAKDGGAGERKSVLKAGEAEKDGKSDAGAKAGEGKPKDAGTDDFVVKLPEGMKEGEVDKAQLADFSKWAKEKGLKPEQATEALAYWKTQNDAAAKQWAKQDQDWYGALEKDSEFGGTNLKASEAALQTALKRFDTGGELAKDLAKYGLENLPSLAKFIARVGKAGGEDKAQITKDGKGEGKKLTQQERLGKFYDAPKAAEK